MPILRIRNIGSKGVIKDLPPFELPPEAWNHAVNVRFIANRIEKVGGFFPVLTERMPDAEPLAILTKNNTRDQIYATKDTIYRVIGKDHTVVSKMSDPDGDPDDQDNAFKYHAHPESTWYYTTLSNAIVMNTPLDPPQGMAVHEHRFHDLPGWGQPQGPDGPQLDWRAGRIRAFRNYLIALDVTESGVEMPQRVRWSDVAYVNALPLNWIENDENKDGGYNDLSDANGRVVDGVPLRDSFVVYTDKETYLMDYVGGELIFQFRKLFSDSGILAPECAVEFESKHFVISEDDIFVHNGSSRQPVASARIKKWLIEEISSVNPMATKVFAYTPAKEIWVLYVGPGQYSEDEENVSWQCDKCAVWNWEWDTWTFFDIPKSYDMNMVPPPNVDSTVWLDYTNPEDYWDSEKWVKLKWSELGKDFIKNVPYIASPDKCFYTMDVGSDQIRYNAVDKSVSVLPVTAELHRYHLDMDEVVESTRLHKFITTVVPQFRGNGFIHAYIGGSYNTTEAPTWDNFQTFEIEDDIKLDCFSNNRYPAFKFIDFSDGTWSMQGYDLEYKTEGTR